jgi:hypothetical protein
MDSPPIRLRPHHLLCILNHVGKGYSERFTQNMGEILEQINEGDRDIILHHGPDAICAPRLCDKDDKTCHCLELHITDRDNEALGDFAKFPEFSLFKIGNRFRLTKDLINRLRAVYKTQEIRTACKGCEWYDLCTDISNNGYKGTKLK